MSRLYSGHMPAWTCSACSASNSAEARFCGQCGEKASAGAQQPAGWTCASCQGANPAASKFCGHCGSSAPTPAAGRLEDERRLVTALFADISGFTALSESLDPEALMEVIDPVIAALSAIVGRHDGHVDKYAGDALLAYFGAPVAHDDDAERTLQVAVEMHEEMARIRATLAHAGELTLRIGVNTGHAVARVFGSEVRMDYSILGDAVNVAQRLESQAPPGETYVGEATRRLVASIFSFKDAGQLSLKGKAEHVQAWCLQGRILHVEDDRAMVGRDDELRAVLEAVRAGNAVAGSGAPGAGGRRHRRRVRGGAGGGETPPPPGGPPPHRAELAADSLSVVRQGAPVLAVRGAASAQLGATEPVLLHTPRRSGARLAGPDSRGASPWPPRGLRAVAAVTCTVRPCNRGCPLARRVVAGADETAGPALRRHVGQPVSHDSRGSPRRLAGGAP